MEEGLLSVPNQLHGLINRDRFSFGRKEGTKKRGKRVDPRPRDRNTGKVYYVHELWDCPTRLRCEVTRGLPVPTGLSNVSKDGHKTGV